MGADDGVRAWLDGELVLSHHAHGAAKQDELRVPVHLAAGVHALLLRVENATAQCELYARLAGLDGRALATVRPVLEPEAPDWAAAASAAPELFALEELARLLAPMARERLELGAPEDAVELTALGAAPGYPRWHSGLTGKAVAPEDPVPNLGQEGLLVLRPASAERPARLLLRARVPEAASLRVRYSPDAAAPGARARLRLAYLDGAEEVALGEDETAQGGKPAKKGWREWSADLAALAGRDVLLLLDADGGEGAPPATVFLDEIALERAR